MARVELMGIGEISSLARGGVGLAVRKQSPSDGRHVDGPGEQQDHADGRELEQAEGLEGEVG